MRGMPPVRWLLVALASLVLLLVALLWWWQARVPHIPLLIEHRGEYPVALLRFHGAGVAQPVQLQQLLPGEQRSLVLPLRRTGALRLEARSERAQVDSQLLEDVADLRRLARDERPSLLVGPGERYVLLVRDGL